MFKGQSSNENLIETENEELSKEKSKNENTSHNHANGNVVQEESKDVRRIKVKNRDNPEHVLEDLMDEVVQLHDFKDQLNLMNDDLKNEIGEIKARITKRKIERGEIEVASYENEADKIKAKSKIIIPRFRFNGNNFNEMINQINDLSKRMDPYEEGLELSSSTNNSTMHNSYNFDFENMPVGELIRYVSIATTTRYEMTDKGFQFITPERSQKPETKDSVSSIDDVFEDEVVQDNYELEEEPIEKRIEKVEKNKTRINAVIKQLQMEQNNLNNQKNKLIKQAVRLNTN